MNKSLLKKAAVVLVLLALVVAFKVLGFGDYLTLEYIKESHARFSALYAARPVTVLASYMLVYVLAIALSLPAATVLTIAAGALFGFVTGTVAVSFASTIGATLACGASRFLLRDWVQGRLGDRLETVNRGIEHEGALYLFSMRLIPGIPFWAINLAMGLTKMPLRRFFWVSQLGMLAGTMAYVNAGRELARIASPMGVLSILSTRVIIAFVLLGILPITAKKLMAFYKGRFVKPPDRTGD